MPKKPVHQLIHAPLTKAELASIRRDLADLPAAAARQGTTLDRYDRRAEEFAGKYYFDLGCWLYYYNKVGERRLNTVSARVDCMRRIFEAGYTNPHYEFFTAFHFGERDFDSILEQGDGREVVAGLLAYAEAHPSANMTQALRELGWIEAPADYQADTVEETEAPAFA